MAEDNRIGGFARSSGNGILIGGDAGEPAETVIILGSRQEADLGFASIVEMHAGFLNPGLLDGRELDNGLAWLAGQQGHSLRELRAAVLDYYAEGHAACRERHGAFLASVAAELADFFGRSGCIAVPARLGARDVEKLAEGALVTMPAISTVGLLDPFGTKSGGLGIQLERPLTIPAHMRSCLRIDGIQVPIGGLHGLPGRAWKKPLGAIPTFDPVSVSPRVFPTINHSQGKSSGWRNSMQQVPFPEMDFATEQNAAEILISFYQDLGWNLRDTIDPKLIEINDQQWKDICDRFNALSREAGEVPAGFVWMNSGPSASADVPYGQVRIESRAFAHFQDGLTSTDKRIIDEVVRERNHVADGAIRLEADYRDGIGDLPQKAYDARRRPPEDIRTNLLVAIDAAWMDTVEAIVDDAAGHAGFEPDSLNYEFARQYVIDKYSIDIPYDHYLEQPIAVNIIIGTDAESNLDFGSIYGMKDGLLKDLPLDPKTTDNGLTWLLEQQGYTFQDFQTACNDLLHFDFDEHERKHGAFMSSLVDELNNFTNSMGAVTVLASMSLYEFVQMQEPGATVIVPENAAVGLFSPWAGGGSAMGIVLDKPLAIPSDMRFDIQIEGAECREHTVNQTYALTPGTWKQIASVGVPGKDARSLPLDEQIKTAKERAAGKNEPHFGPDKRERPHEIER